MHEPGARVASLVTNNEVATFVGNGVGGHQSDITSWWVDGVEGNAAVVETVTLAEDHEIVSVEMDRVGQRNGRLDDKVDPFTEVGDLDGQTTRVRWDGVEVDDIVESWVTPLRHEGGAGESPFVEVGGLVIRSNNNGLLNGLVLSTRVEGEVRHQALQWLVHTFNLVGVCGGSGSCSLVGAFVADDTLDVGGLDHGSADGLVVSTHPVAARGLISLEDEVVSLSNVDVDNVGGIRLERDEIALDDGKSVLVNEELESGLNGGVDQTKAVRLATLDSHLEALAGGGFGLLPDVHAVDQASVEEGVAMGWSALDRLLGIVHLVNGGVGPVLENNNLLLIICGASRAMNNNGSKYTLIGLESKVRVPPRSSVVVSAEPVGHAVARSQRALGDAGNTVHLVGAVLSEAVEMDRSSVSCGGVQFVVDVDNDPITPVRLNRGAGHLSVDEQRHALNSIRSDSGVRDVEVVLNLVASVGDNLIIVILDRVTAEGGWVRARVTLARLAGVEAERLGSALRRRRVISRWSRRSGAVRRMGRSRAVWERGRSRAVRGRWGSRAVWRMSRSRGVGSKR